jgi:ligand-binding sensor domain-containing protein
MKGNGVGLSIGACVVALCLAALMAHAGEPDWTIIKRSNTGIPGVEVHFAKFDPQGNLWVSARDWFWGEGGVAVYNWERWTTYSNLDTPMPSEWVHSIAFDESGVTWMGTDAGLVRFDGVDWRTFDRSNSPLPGNQVFGLRLDGLGRLWMVYQQTGEGIDGVAMFDGAAWSIWSKQDIGDLAVAYGNLAVDAANNVWLGTRYRGGIVRYDGSDWTVYDASNGYSDYPAECVTLGRDGHIWANWEGIKMYDGTQWIPKPNLPGDHMYSALFVESDGTYWVGTYGGVLAYFNGSGWSLHDYGNHLYSIDKDAQGRIWCGGLAFVRRLNADLSWTTYSPYNTGLPDNFDRGIGFDTEGRAWIAGVGVSSFDGATWRCFNPYNDGFEPWPFQSDVADAVLGTGDGSVWAAPTMQGIAARWNGREWFEYSFGYNVECFTEDATGSLWAGGGFGAARFNGSGFVTYPCPFLVNDIDAEFSGGVWAATFGGLARLDGGAWAFYNTSNSGIPTNQVWSVASGPAGDVWAGTEQGLAHFDGEAWTVYTEANSGLPANMIRAVDVRSDGLVAVGAFEGVEWPYHGGVALYDGYTWRTYTTENSPLRHEQVEAVEFAANGDLWINSVSEGVAVLHVGGPTSVPGSDLIAQIGLRNEPNPFSTRTMIRFTLSRPSWATLKVFDVSGRLVSTLLDEDLAPQSYRIPFEAPALRSGVYLYRLETDRVSSSGKMVLVR